MFGASAGSRGRPVGTLLLPFLVSILINHQMWGYFVSRPSVDPRIVQARRIESVTEVETRSDSSGNVTIWGLPIKDVDSYIPVNSQEGDYYVLDGRVLRALKDRQALPAQPRQISSARLSSLYKTIENTGRFEDGENGYRDAKQLSGIVVEAIGRDGRPLVFAGVRRREVSNDHYPYYEFLFTSESSSGVLKLLSFQRFYYDVAAIEGVEWPAFFPGLAFLGLIATLPVQGFLVWRGRCRG